MRGRVRKQIDAANERASQALDPYTRGKFDGLHNRQRPSQDYWGGEDLKDWLRGWREGQRLRADGGEPTPSAQPSDGPSGDRGLVELVVKNGVGKRGRQVSRWETRRAEYLRNKGV